MAYDLQVERQLAIGASAATTGDKAAVAFSMPVTVHLFAVTNKTAATITSGAIQLVRQPTAGSTAGESVLTTLNVPASGYSQGRVLYKSIVDGRLAPGDALVVRVTTANGSFTNFDAAVWVEFSHENLANSSDAILSA